MIPYGRQSISEEDIQAVVRVLRSDFLTQGPAVPAFESVVADYCRAEFSVAVNSATSALHIACLALGVGPGDWVWTSPITFVASANCARYCGAEIDFVDIDPKTYNLCAVALAEKLESAERHGRLPKVVIPVHLAGQSCDMRAVHELSNKYGFRIIEDASHAIGGRYRDEPVGSCHYSDVTVFSFHPVKIVTTAEGGVATTNDAHLASRMARLRTHGVTREPSEMVGVPDGGWYYEQVELGFNYRITDLHAALGISQMGRLDEFVQARHRLADRYDSALADLPVTTPYRDPDGYSAFHLYVVQIAERERVYAELRQAGIGVNVHYIPVNRQPWHRAHATVVSETPNANAYYARALSIPLFPDLSDGEQEEVVAALRGAVA